MGWAFSFWQLLFTVDADEYITVYKDGKIICMDKKAIVAMTVDTFYLHCSVKKLEVVNNGLHIELGGEIKKMEE